MMEGKKHDYQAIVSTPFGAIGIKMHQSELRHIDLLPEGVVSEVAEGSPVGRVTEEINGYFRDPESRFSTPLKLQGTDFQRRVWNRLQNIPMGSTLTYGQLADELDTSPRAVGNACRANPCPVVVPCHRVVGKTDLGGFAGQQGGKLLQIKRWLLRHEGWL